MAEREVICASTRQALNLLEEIEYDAYIAPLFVRQLTWIDSAFCGHFPFLNLLFKVLCPKVYVELGVYYGASLAAACTTVRQYRLNTKCCGVDTWLGDEHTGSYEGERMYSGLKSFLDTHFQKSSLVSSTFREARLSFADGSVDLLLIDGLHKYDAVREDFETWYSAVSPEGVILFHDIAVRDSGFGVYRLWEELKKHSATMEFLHCCGLGVLFMHPRSKAAEAFEVLRRDEVLFANYSRLAEQLGRLMNEYDREIWRMQGGLPGKKRSISTRLSAAVVAALKGFRQAARELLHD